MYEASVEGAFRARHALRLPDGSMERPHEHVWRVRAAFRSERLGKVSGMVIDFLDVDKAIKRIALELDGGDLNELEVFSDARASAERVAEWLAGMLADALEQGDLLYSVNVTEAPGCQATYFLKGGS